MTPQIVVLSRDQVRRVASVVEAVKAKQGTARAAAKALGIGHARVSAILARPGSLRVVRGSLEKIAKAAEPAVTVEQLLGGRVELASARPMPPGARVIVQRGRRRQ